MTEKEFQAQVLVEFAKLNGQIGLLDGKVNTLDGKFDALDGKFNTLGGKFNALDGKVNTLDGKVDRISEDLTDFKTNQEQFNAAIWNLNTQAFEAISEIRSEVIAPWKLRKNV